VADGLPLPQQIPIGRLTDSTFTHDEEGRVTGRIRLRVVTPKGLFTGKIEVFQTDPDHVRAILTEATLKKKALGNWTRYVPNGTPRRAAKDRCE
jgi:hypothetical protein